MQLGFWRREVWTPYLSSFPRIQATSCMKFPISFQNLKTPQACSGTKRKQHHHAVQNPYAGPLLSIEYLGQKRLEIYTSSLSPTPAPNLGQEISTFWLLRSFILDLAGGGGWGFWLAVPFYSVQDCSQDYFILGWVVRGKICTGP